MKIGFDAKRLLFNQTGLGNYSRQWVQALMRHPEHQLHLFSPREATFESLPVHSPSQSINPFYNKMWRSWGMGLDAAKLQCDVFHGLSNEIPMDRAKIPMVCTIHDVIFKEFPSHYAFFDRQIYDYKTRYACSNSEAIVVTSETTKNQLLQYYNADPSRIHVVYQSVKSEFTQAHWSPDRDSPYILYYSSFNPRKNQIKLIESFALIAKKVPFDLYLAGSGRGLGEIQAKIKALHLETRVHVFLAPTDEKIVELLQNACGFVYPSLQEGFGIPLVEAAHVGVPMAVSNIPIFQELTDNKAAAYFNPFDITEMAEALISLFDQSYKPLNTDVSYQRIIDLTSSEQMAKRAISVYKKVIG